MKKVEFPIGGTAHDTVQHLEAMLEAVGIDYEYSDKWEHTTILIITVSLGQYEDLTKLERVLRSLRALIRYTESNQEGGNA